MLQVSSKKGLRTSATSSLMIAQVGVSRLSRMRLALLLSRRTLLMQVDPAKHLAFSSSSSRKRPFSRTPSPCRTPSDPDQRPGKVPKVEGGHLPSSSKSVMTPPNPSFRRPPSHHGRGSPLNPSRSFGNNSKSRRGKGTAAARLQQPTLPEPVYSADYVRSTHEKKPLKAIWAENPKSPLTNYLKAAFDSMPEYESVLGVAANGQTLWRTTIRIQDGDYDITACGDHANRKESEKLAALSALLQLDGLGAVRIQIPLRFPRVQVIGSTDGIVILPLQSFIFSTIASNAGYLLA